MKTFSVQTLGCKVNQYESEQVAAYLRARGLSESETPDRAELRIINSCSVTVQAASQSRQSVRRATRLPVLTGHSACGTAAFVSVPPKAEGTQTNGPRVVVIGCWATSDKPAAEALDGVDAVLTHHDDLATEFDRLLSLWRSEDCESEDPAPVTRPPTSHASDENPQRLMDAGNKDALKNAVAENRTRANKPILKRIVNEISGARSLPLLGEHQSGRQRAFLKIQDGCDAHCTYCIIPRLRPSLWSKPVDDTVDEARKLVESGHREIVLTGIFLGAYGYSTALRRRQQPGDAPLAMLVSALCTRVPGLQRLRLSSLEPGDLDDELLATLTSHPQVVPHFHLPLQSGSDLLLRRMNRQYGRDQFLELVGKISNVFDRPARTSDIIVGFPGESDEQFRHTLEVVRAARFIHVHAFPYSPRPGTAAARWERDVPGEVVNERIRQLIELAGEFSREYRKSFVGTEVSVIVERGSYPCGQKLLRRGRCERYFAVDFEGANVLPGDVMKVRVESIRDERTFGRLSGGGAE